MSKKYVFSQATKHAAKARIALAGPSGSGKTYTALALATAMAEQIAVIDTERGSASKYADVFAFDTVVLDQFDPRDLIEALTAAEAGGYDVVVVDSLSHFWMGKGGMLELVDNAAKRFGGGNSLAGWKEARPVERRMVDAMLAYPGHVIATMRTKTEYVVEENERGRKVLRKVGLKPEQRDGIEYEFDIVADLDLDNNLIVAKSRCPALAGAVINKAGAATAATIVGWLDGPPPDAPNTPSGEQRAHEVSSARDRLSVPVSGEVAGHAAALEAADVWMASIVERIAAAETVGELRGELWEEIISKAHAGVISDADRADLGSLMAHRKTQLEQHDAAGVAV